MKSVLDCFVSVLLLVGSLITMSAYATEGGAKKVIHDYYQAVQMQDLDKFMGLLADNVAHDINEGSTEVGKDKFKSFMIEQFSHGKISIKDLIILTSEDGKLAMTRFMCSGKYEKSIEGLPKAHGQDWQIPVVSYFKINGKKIEHVAVYYNFNEWKKQIS